MQKLDYTVRIVNRRNLRRCDHNNAVGIRRRQLKTAVNSRRTVNQNVIKFFSQVRQQIFHLFFIQIVFGVTGARRRYDPEIRIPLVPDQRLLNAASPGQDIDQIIEDPVFQSMTTSRFLKPISVSTNTTFLSNSESPAPTLAVVVVCQRRLFLR